MLRFCLFFIRISEFFVATSQQLVKAANKKRQKDKKTKRQKDKKTKKEKYKKDKKTKRVFNIVKPGPDNEGSLYTKKENL